jgi:hypothetical protein
MSRPGIEPGPPRWEARTRRINTYSKHLHMSLRHIPTKCSLKVWWQDSTLFVYFSYFITNIHSSYHTHLSVTICRGLSPSLHRLSAQWEKPPCGAEQRIELGPALLQADALTTESRRTIIFLLLLLKCLPWECFCS